MTEETSKMHYDSTLLQAHMQSTLVARLLHNRAGATTDGTYPSSAAYLSKDSMPNSEVMNNYQQASCKLIETPKSSNTQQALLFAV